MDKGICLQQYFREIITFASSLMKKVQYNYTFHRSSSVHALPQPVVILDGTLHQFKDNAFRLVKTLRLQFYKGLTIRPMDQRSRKESPTWTAT